MSAPAAPDAPPATRHAFHNEYCYAETGDEMQLMPHDAGFFSCCSLRLAALLHFHARRGAPGAVDSSRLWTRYTPPDAQGDVTAHFFEPARAPAAGACAFTPAAQFGAYRDFDHARAAPYVARYFAPAAPIRAREARLRADYGLDPDRCCAIYYRGTDKRSETALAPFAAFGDRLDALRARHAGLAVLLQTDSAPFRDYMRARCPDAVLLRENEVSYSHAGIHNESAPEKNHADIQRLFAAVLFMAKCRHLICSSGNVAHWTTLYRGGARGVHQYLNDGWIDPDPDPDPAPDAFPDSPPISR